MNTSSAKAQAVDPVTVEIIRNGLLAVTEEMKTNLTRTAYNLIIYEALDFTVGLFTTNGDTVSIGLGLPMFIRGMSETVKAKIKHYGLSGIKPGDILVTNDAYTTGSHLNHFTFTMPVFHKGELVAFTCCMAHWLDVGGTLGQVTTDIYSEGIQIPIVKYRKEGIVNQELVDIIAMNVRLSERAMGDLRAQITAVTTGERRSWSSSSDTARMRCWDPSPTLWIIPKRLRARTRARYPMAYMKPSHSWTTMASRSAKKFRSESVWRSVETR